MVRVGQITFEIDLINRLRQQIGQLAEALFTPDANTNADDVIATARALRDVAGTTYGLAIIGSYEAGGGVFGTGAGKTWIALVGDGVEEVYELGYGSTEDFTVTRIGNQAFAMLWRIVR